MALAPLDQPAQIVGAIAAALELRLDAASEPIEQLPRCLRAKHLLLILDNVEHLLDGADTMAAIMRAAPHISILATSRARIQLPEEIVVSLAGIDVPPTIDDEQALERGAMQLLIQRARLARPDLDLTPAELDAAIRICQLVDGMPLALILAASWADMLSLATIASEIGQSLDILEAELRDLPPRQRSVHAVFDASWRRLTSPGRAVFARLAVFCGGFTREAAFEVAGADLRALRLLLNSSFIVVETYNRFSIHELLRQYAATRLATPAEHAELCDRHSAYYLAFLQRREPDLRREYQARSFAAIERELENIRHAWHHALQRQDARSIDLALEATFLFGEKRGHYCEIDELLMQVRQQLAPTPAPNSGLWQRLTSRLSILRSRAPRDRQIPLAELEDSLALAQQSGLAAEEALASLAIGLYYARTENDYARALPAFKHAYTLHRNLDDRFYMAEDLARVGICYGYLGDIAAFYRCCEDAYDIAMAEHDMVGMLTAQANLTESLLHQGRYTAVLEHGTRQLAMAEALGLRSFIIHGQLYVALIHLLHGELNEARQIALAGYRLSAETSSALMMGINLAVLALHASMSGDYPLALQFAEESLHYPLNLLGEVQTYWALALAHCGLERNTAAHESLHAAFASAARFATCVPQVWLLPVAAVLAVRSSDIGRATELLALATSHPFCANGWMAHWLPLRNLRTRLETTPGQAAFIAAWQQGANRDLQHVAGELTSLVGQSRIA